MAQDGRLAQRSTVQRVLRAEVVPLTIVVEGRLHRLSTALAARAIVVGEGRRDHAGVPLRHDCRGERAFVNG